MYAIRSYYEYALVEVMVEPGRADELMTIADARCSYENALTNLPEDSSAIAQVRFSQSESYNFV